MAESNPLYSQIAVKGILVNDNRALLLQAQVNDRFFWDFPGGRVEPGESLSKALNRECLEELPGIERIIVGNLVHAHLTKRLADNEPMVLLYYTIESVTNDFDISEEHLRKKWITVDNIEKLVDEHPDTELFPSDKQALLCALA